MSSLRPTGGLAAMLMLAACGSAPEREEAPAGPPPKPSFDQTIPGVQATIAGLGAPWAKPARNDMVPDAATGGTIISTSGDRGEAKLYRLPDGWIRQVGLASGVGKTCGDPADVERAIPLLLTGLATKVTLTPAQAQRLKVSVADGPPVTVELRGVRVTAQGGCVQQLTVTAIERPPSPPTRL
ncbi:hypothetical protein NDN01_01115 [Sphingomonas sp. QA11]|uniref:hypothetical protein n=1 Tax=Sphingomonas sp. QA11 TaxID=2950605 RepID=UPI00234B4BD3|nr:hypothetical protein [Sphingomonas sp. QA11]WCM27567.1 hypothetical protein NDN01_01115 [Sphingomonas sp. QA11]